MSTVEGVVSWTKVTNMCLTAGVPKGARVKSMCAQISQTPPRSTRGMERSNTTQMDSRHNPTQRSRTQKMFFFYILTCVLVGMMKSIEGVALVPRWWQEEGWCLLRNKEILPSEVYMKSGVIIATRRKGGKESYQDMRTIVHIGRCHQCHKSNVSINLQNLSSIQISTPGEKRSCTCHQRRKMRFTVYHLQSPSKQREKRVGGPFQWWLMHQRLR